MFYMAQWISKTHDPLSKWYAHNIYIMPKYLVCMYLNIVVCMCGCVYIFKMYSELSVVLSDGEQRGQ